MFDIAVIGGGVNGCGIARNAAGRSLRVLLLEREDLASGTSSASTKLIHGGLRYLEHYEFRLVRESLKEREVLWAMAPHIVWPLRFVLPHHGAQRPRFLIRLGLFLYDHLGGREKLPASCGLDLTQDPAGLPLKPEFRRGFEYSDCWVEDSRLVVLNAMDAALRGASIRVRSELISAKRQADHWRLIIEDRVSGRREEARSRILINAAGPWVSEVAGKRLGLAARATTRLVKGSHIVVPRLFAHERAYIFQNRDRRIVFAIPYERDFTLIGTTDVDFAGDPGDVEISGEEIAYLCGAVSAYFREPLSPEQIVWSYSGVRPLYDDGASSAQKATRDYVLELDAPGVAAPALSVFGGKITTYRHLAEEALERLARWLPPDARPWTRGASLPGGDFEAGAFEALVEDVAELCPRLPDGVPRRLVRAYGSRARDILAEIAAEGPGRDFGAGLTEAEVRYLIRQEYARSAEDILWRRSKLGLRLSREQQAALAAWVAAHLEALVPDGGPLPHVSEER